MIEARQAMGQACQKIDDVDGAIEAFGQLSNSNLIRRGS